MAEKNIKAIDIDKESADDMDVEPVKTKGVEAKTYSKDDPIPAPNSSLARVHKGK